MQESTTYQKILRDGRDEGRIEEARGLLLRQGSRRFGEPDATTVATIEGIRDIDRLEALCDRFVDPSVRDWN
jgi:hypothetical protein